MRPGKQRSKVYFIYFPNKQKRRYIDNGTVRDQGPEKQRGNLDLVTKKAYMCDRKT